MQGRIQDFQIEGEQKIVCTQRNIPTAKREVHYGWGSRALVKIKISSNGFCL